MFPWRIFHQLFADIIRFLLFLLATKKFLWESAWILDPEKWPSSKLNTKDIDLLTSARTLNIKRNKLIIWFHDIICNVFFLFKRIYYNLHLEISTLITAYRICKKKVTSNFSSDNSTMRKYSFSCRTNYESSASFVAISTQIMLVCTCVAVAGRRRGALFIYLSRTSASVPRAEISASRAKYFRGCCATRKISRMHIQAINEHVSFEQRTFTSLVVVRRSKVFRLSSHACRYTERASRDAIADVCTKRVDDFHPPAHRVHCTVRAWPWHLAIGQLAWHACPRGYQSWNMFVLLFIGFAALWPRSRGIRVDGMTGVGLASNNICSSNREFLFPSFAQFFFFSFFLFFFFDTEKWHVTSFNRRVVYTRAVISVISV